MPLVSSFLPNDWVFAVNAVLHLISINQPYRPPYTAIVARKIDAIYYVYMIGLLNTEFSILCIFLSASAFPLGGNLVFSTPFLYRHQIDFTFIFLPGEEGEEIEF